jgi:hypothetical protein
MTAGPRQHSRSWYRAPSGLMTIFLFFPDFHAFRNRASSSTSGRVYYWSLPLSHSLLTNVKTIKSGKYFHVHAVWLLDGVWIYWIAWYSAWLHFTIHCYTNTRVHSHVSTSRCSVAASNSGRSPSSGFPNYPRPQLPAPHSNSSQWLDLSSSLTHLSLSWL